MVVIDRIITVTVVNACAVIHFCWNATNWWNFGRLASLCNEMKITIIILLLLLLLLYYYYLIDNSNYIVSVVFATRDQAVSFEIFPNNGMITEPTVFIRFYTTTGN